jgi:N-ethylmaleimide reductase
MTVSLYSPVRIGDIDAANRVFMAPLTRCRADPQTLAAGALQAEYYAQRAGAGLIISEATPVERAGVGYVNTPCIHTPDQEAGWRTVTDAVHMAGGKIVAQLWHVGAVSHPELQVDGAQPVSASAYTAVGTTVTPLGKRERLPARALALHEIGALVEAYRHASRVAQRAGFDGVEIHGANGYLLEQFIRDTVNRRTDAYGGPIAHRIRLPLEVVDAAVSVFGKGRVGIRLSPLTPSNGCPQDGAPQATYGALVEALAGRDIAFLHFIEGATGGARALDGFDFARARRTFPGAYVANNGYTLEMAEAAVADGRVDAVAFGRPFIANPDLPERLQRRQPLAAFDSKTLYSPGPRGYTDYPLAA